MAREVDELIAASASVGRVTPIVAEATVSDDPGGFALTLTVSDAGAPRRRHIGAPTCEELAHAAALIVAIAVDPTILERRADTNNAGPLPATGTTPTPAPPSRSVHCRLTDLPLQSTAPPPICPKQDVAAPPQPPPAPSPAATAPLFWRLGFGSLVASNVLPKVKLGVNLLGAIQGKLARFELSASALSANVEATQVPGASAYFSLYRAAPRGCWLVAATAWAAGPCVGMEFGWLTGTGSGVDNNHTRSTLWLASTFGGMFEYRLGSSAFLLATADLGVPLKRDEEFLLAGERLFKPSVSGTIGLNLAAGWH